MSKTGLFAEGLNKTYLTGAHKIHVNKNISFHAEESSMIWIYGNSGAGKSTFLNLISGIDTPDSGVIEWDGTVISEMSGAERSLFRLKNCGLIFQFFELIKAQSVFENAALPLKIMHKGKAEINEILYPLFECFGLKELVYKKPAELSGGEKQRVSIVRALASKPKYIIADEITSSLDAKLSHHVYSYLQTYLKERNGIGIFVSHDPIIRHYADKVYNMSGGCLTEAEV